MRVMVAGLLLSLPGLVFAACHYDWTEIPKAPATCRSKSDCTSNEYCAFPDRLCGTGGPGQCAPVPTEPSCADASFEIACGCSGRTQKSRCQVNALGDDLSLGACAPDPTFGLHCGVVFCGFKTQYCITYVYDGGVDNACGDLTSKNDDCTAVDMSVCDGGACAVGEAGDIEVLCPHERR